MKTLIKNAHAVDPQVGLDKVVDVLIDGDVIAEVGENLSADVDAVCDLSGRYLVPGLVDIHVHLREPGFEYKEDIASGTRAALNGGFTDVCCMANTKPVTDTAAGVEYIKARAKEADNCNVHVAGACTQGLKGEILAEMGDMDAHGAVAFTDDGRGIQDAGMMRRVMDYAVQFGHPIMDHCQDESLVDKGQVNEGIASTRLGMLGWPAAGEEIHIARDIELARLTGAHLHIQHLTSGHGIELVRAGKAAGVNVTCEVTPHHMFLTEDAIGGDYNTALKVNPPLRTAADAQAIIDAVVDGAVDCIVTDHAPHADFEKAREFEEAPFGMTGIETSLGAVLTNLVNPGTISVSRMVELMCVNPRAIIGIEPVKIEAGSVANLTAFDMDAEWDVTEDYFQSKATNCGFTGAHFKGKATDVFVKGAAKMRDGELL